jgi:AcrR family transcriptional regulator
MKQLSRSSGRPSPEMAKAATSAADNPYRRSLLRRQRSVDTRASVVRAAARLWAEQGFDGPTIEDICAAAGIARSTFYFHFESKDELIDELTWATAAATASDVEAALGAGSLDAQIDAFIDAVAGRMTKVPRPFVALVLRRAATRNVPGETPDDRVDFARILTPLLERATADDELRPSVDPDELAAILSSMTMEAILRWANGRTPAHGLRDSLALRFELVLDGLAI